MTEETLDKLQKTLEVWSSSHRYDLIIGTAKKILALDPLNRIATYELLRSYNNTLQYEDLYSATTTALQNWPDDPILYDFLYLYYLYLGGENYIKARDAIEKAIELDPLKGYYYRQLGEIYLINREPEKAFKYLSEAVKLSPSKTEYRSRLALSLIRLNKIKEGLKLTEESLKEDPGIPGVLDNAGMVYILTGDIEKAEELFKDALSKFPTYNYFQSHLEWVLREKKDKESRLKQGKKYTPLYIRQNGTKRFFDEDKI